MIPKPIRKSDENVLNVYRKARCCLCGCRPCDPAHIKTRGSGGPDEHWNLIALCREHHTEQGQIGFWRMCEKYPFVRQILAGKGWLFGGDKKLKREF